MGGEIPRRVTMSAMFAKRVAWAWLLAAVLLLGSVDLGPLHPQGEGLSLGAPDQGHVYYPDARHFGQPTHVERAAAAKRPTCPLCLHHVRTAGSHLPRVAAVEPPALDARPGTALAQVPTSAASAPSSARGPPSLS
jgi:hypothetical protein